MIYISVWIKHFWLFLIFSSIFLHVNRLFRTVMINKKYFQDSDGDTPMHDAIKQRDDKSSIISDLLQSPLANFSQTNADNFNVLHWATLMNFKLYVSNIYNLFICLKQSLFFVNAKLNTTSWSYLILDFSFLR